MATENNQSTTSITAIDDNTSKSNANDTDRKFSSHDEKCEITNVKQHIEIQKEKATKYNEIDASDMNRYPINESLCVLPHRWQAYLLGLKFKRSDADEIVQSDNIFNF